MATKRTKNNGAPPALKEVVAIAHPKEDASRKNIPTAEFQSIAPDEVRKAVPVTYPRNAGGLEEEKAARNRDLDPQLVWRGKDQQDWTDLVVQAPPLYIQEKVHPKVLIDDLRRRGPADESQLGLFAEAFNGVPEGDAKTEFYQHDANWTNRMILGDSLQVMASLAEREGLRGKVQCIYFDPPYGIKFNSNFQWSTTTRDVKDGDPTHISREPEQVKAFRDTWRDGIHSYLTYLRDRLTLARDLLADSGSIFVQIGQENVHRLRSLMEETFGTECLVCEIVVKKKGAQKSAFIDPVNDYILWFSKSPRSANGTKYKALFEDRPLDYEAIDYFSQVETNDGRILNLKDRDLLQHKDYRLFPKAIDLDFPEARLLRQWPITNGGYRENQMHPVRFRGTDFSPPKNRCWSHQSRPLATGLSGMDRVAAASRLMANGRSLDFKRYYSDFPFKNLSNWWDGFRGALEQVYVVQTNERLIERCILMVTDPGDLVLDPTCGSGTTAYVAEQWGRRWITIDTSRVALALARARVMGARYPYYLLADTAEGQRKEAEVTRKPPSSQPTYGRLRQGFVYRRVAYITSSTIANNAEIDVIWGSYQTRLEPLRSALNAALGTAYEEWEIPRDASDNWPEAARTAHAEWWKQRIARQQEIDASIAAKADTEYLYDKPYEDPKKVRVAGPFTVESLAPHRTLEVDENGDVRDPRDRTPEAASFVDMILDNLRRAGVQQAHKDDKIDFEALNPWPGEWICAEGRYRDGEGKPRRAGVFIGPEFGTVSRQDLVQAAREAGDAGFDVVLACAFSFDAHSTNLQKLGRIAVLQVRMNADLHMAEDLKNTGKGNLFVIFGEPDVDLRPAAGGQWRVEVQGRDVFHPATGEVRSDGPDGIACWFIDTDYNGESFFVRHAYFLGQNDPYKSLKTTLKAEIDPEAWESLHSAVSRPFGRPSSGRIAVKVINHLGDEVMRVFRVPEETR